MERARTCFRSVPCKVRTAPRTPEADCEGCATGAGAAGASSAEEAPGDWFGSSARGADRTPVGVVAAAGAMALWRPLRVAGATARGCEARSVAVRAAGAWTETEAAGSAVRATVSVAAGAAARTVVVTVRAVSVAVFATACTVLLSVACTRARRVGCPGRPFPRATVASRRAEAERPVPPSRLHPQPCRCWCYRG
jgi:hypothetical protein